MSFDFDLEMDFAEFENFLDEKFYKASARGLKQGLNRAQKGAITEAVDKIQKEFPLGSGGAGAFSTRIRGDIKPGAKASGDDISSMFAQVDVESDKAVNMIRATNSLTVSKRGVQVLATVRQGKHFLLGKKRFIAKSNGAKVVFMRTGKVNDKGKQRLIPQRIKRIALMLQDDKVWPGYEEAVNERIYNEVSQAISNAIDRL